MSTPTAQPALDAAAKNALPRTVVALGWVSLLTAGASDMISLAAVLGNH